MVNAAEFFPGSEDIHGSRRSLRNGEVVALSDQPRLVQPSEVVPSRSPVLWQAERVDAGV